MHSDTFNDKVLALQKDSDADVAKTAVATAHQLGIDRPAGGANDLIQTLSYETVVAQATKAKGDPKVGAELFTRQGCVACHTV